ncbi:MAG: arabinogalactan oligomer / maltooligosaccharide transport system substrate-binding protein [Acidobacteriota bacterium]|jgi:arabinogalactan oligomer/maltooligosaccharide transport system substrate-binding protein|nr:arabinogalactan oligomer / maltooligosaccharide transport system substrate-binding protein [Acidobacteriota bacterium]
MRHALLLLLLLWTAPAGSEEADEKRIVLWHSYQGAARQVFEKLVDGFRNKDGWTATAVAISPDLLPSRIATLIPRGEGPDVFLYTQDRLGAWVEAGGIVERVAPDDRIRARFLPGTLDALTIQGKYYGVPLEVRTVALIFNRNLLPEPPLSSREMVAQGQRLTSPELGKFGLATWYTDFYYHAPLMHAFGGRLFGSSGELTVNSAPNVKSVALLKTWLREGFLPAGPSTTLITSLFNQGKLAMVIGGPSFVERIDPAVSFGVVPLPALDEAGGKPMRPWMTVQGIHIAATSRNKTVAAQLARYLTDLPAARTLALEAQMIPAHHAVYQDPELSSNWVIQGFRRQLDTAIPMPNHPAMSRIWGPLARALEAVVEKRESPQAALDGAQAVLTP